MDSRERVLTAVEHEEPDRVPIGFEAHQGITDKLMAHYGVQDRLALFRKMGIDGFSVFCESYVSTPYIGPPLHSLADGTKCDFWGIDFHQRNLPLAGLSSFEELAAYPWPDPGWFAYDDVKERCRSVKALGLPAVGGEGGCGIHHVINLRGYMQALVDPLDDPAFTHEYMQRLGDFFVAWNERWLGAAEGEFDIFRCTEEVGANDRMHCAPEVWREFYKPQLKRIFDVAKRHRMKIWLHCCGCCRPVLEDLVEIGIDMWDPVPGYVSGNDQEELKRTFGDRLTFMGGLNTPHVLRCGTPRQVRDEVRRCLDIFAPGGGYIFGGSQVLLDDVPLENAVAMFEEAVIYGVYG